MNISFTGPVGARPAAFALATLFSTGASAFNIDTENADVKLRWDNTVKYSAAARVKDRSPGLSATAFGAGGVVGPNNVNQDDGDNNFGKGLTSSRVDWFSEFDLTAGNFGGRLSAAAWFDDVYNRSTNNATSTGNHIPSSEFQSETREVMGRKGELLDAFVFGRFNVGDHQASVRLGRHTLLWGESLFFGANGIAGGQAPVDLVKLLSVPNSQFKETVRPTGKISGQVQLASDVTIGGYVGFEWEKTRLLPAGAYLSTSDTMGPGAERTYAGALGAFAREGDVNASSGGQGGIQLRWRLPEIDTDLGFYAIRFHSMTPSNLVTTLTAPPAAGGVASSYRWYHHEGVRAFGVSFAKTIDEWAFAGEASYRQNAPLASSSQTAITSIGLGANFDNDSNPPYAVGDTAHLQLSWIASLGPSFIANEASFLGEIAWNRRVSISKNPGMLNPNTDRDATALRMVFSPTYRQVVSGLDLTPTVGIGYTLGRSSAIGPGFGPDKGGDFNIGLGAVYLGSWYANLSYVKYFGTEGPTLDNANNAQYTQALKDRNFVTLSVRTTF